MEEDGSGRCRWETCGGGERELLGRERRWVCRAWARQVGFGVRMEVMTSWMVGRLKRVEVIGRRGGIVAVDLL